MSSFANDPIYKTAPSDIQEIIDAAAAVSETSPDRALTAIGYIDHTSLDGKEGCTQIVTLCEEAKDHGAADPISTAAVCVYGLRVNHLALTVAKEALKGSSVRIAVVNNFPDGDADPQDVYNEAVADLAAGAHELDTVIGAYSYLLDGKVGLAEQSLDAVRRAIDEHNARLADGEPRAILKTILNGAAYTNYDQLRDTATMALEHGADIVQTSTGKEIRIYGVKDIATLPIAAALMSATRAFNNTHGTQRGVKIAGGVRTPIDAERYVVLGATLLGEDAITADRFRFGASASLRAALLAYARPAAPTADAQPAVAGAPGGPNPAY